VSPPAPPGPSDGGGVPQPALDDERRSRLRRAKLGALARDVLGMSGDPVSAGPLTAMLSDGHAVVLVEHGDAATLAGSLVWADRRGAERLTLLVDEGADLVCRLAGHFDLPSGPVQVLAVEGAAASAAEPEPVPVPAPARRSPSLEAELHAAGVEVVVEHGVVRGEVLGLEVARLVEWPTSLGGDGELHLEVGVGRFDRDATAAARPDESPAESLRRAVAMVRERRYPGAPVHPLQMLARERWLRTVVLDEPSLIGAVALRPVEMTLESGGIKDAHPAAAVGEDATGAPLVVVCSTGVDLALVPLAADVRHVHAPGARLLLAVPDRDHHPATRALIGRLRDPAELVGVAPGWG
jgi:hypothetical protein